MLRGRDFSSTDRAAAPPVAVVSDNLAARVWPAQNPIGKRLVDSFGRGKDGRPLQWRTVVGIVGAAHYRELDQPRFDFYVPLAQAESFDPEHIVVKSCAPPRSLANSTRVPSGDQTGASFRPLPAESRELLARSTSISRIVDSVGETDRTNTAWVPSGDNRTVE